MVSDTPRAFAVTHRSVFALVWPIMLASITVPLMGLTDTAVVGRLGDAAMLGGLAVGAVILDLIFTGLNFLRSGTVGLTAQAMGADDRVERVNVLHRALILSALIGLLLILFSLPVLELGLLLMKPGDAVAEAVRSYFMIRIFAAPFTLSNYSILGWLLGLARVRLGLALQVLSSVVNILLSIYLGLVRGYGIEGVAWATVCAELLATAVGLLLALRLGGLARAGWRSLFQGAKIRRTLLLNTDIMIRSMILVFVFSFFTAQGSRLGEVTLAANAILMNFFMLVAFVLDGFANATEQLVGRALGARFRPAFDQAIRISTFWSALLSVLLFGLLILFGPWLIDLLSTHDGVRMEARNYLIWAALTGIFGVLAFQMDGVFIGATWSRDMRNMMILSLLVYLLAWRLLMPLLGNHGLWLALEIFLLVRGISLWWRLQAARQQFCA